MKIEGEGENEEVVVVFFQAEDGIRDLVRSRGLGDVYKRQETPSNPLQDQDRLPPVGGALRGANAHHPEGQALALSLIHI